MYTNNINYENNEIKKEYKYILKQNGFLYDIMDYLERDYRLVTIKNIIINEDEMSIITECDGTLVNINIDYLKKQTILISTSWPYSIIYSNSITKNCIPIGKLYKNNERYVLSKNFVKARNAYSKLKIFELKVNNQVYGITINEFNKKLNEQEIINFLLNDENEINCVTDILTILNKIIDINNFEIKINNMTDNTSIIIIDRGKLTKYVEFYEKDDYKEKIYLNNNEFYIEKTTKEKIDVKNISYIKKIGERK